jgi:hypothetical protein
MRRPALALDLLPLAILAAMLAIALGVEAVLPGGPDGATKLPLAALLTLALLRHRRRQGAREGSEPSTPP